MFVAADANRASSLSIKNRFLSNLEILATEPNPIFEGRVPVA